MDDRRGQGIAWWRVLGWVLSLVALGFIAKWLMSVDHSVWRSLLHLNRAKVILGLLVFQLWFILRYLGWEWISKHFGSQTERSGNLRMWTLSELARYVPGNIWSFAARYQGTRSGGAEKSQAVTALIVEAASLVAGAGVVVALTSSAFFGGVQWWMIGLLAVVIIAARLLLPRAARKFSALQPLSTIPSSQIIGLVLWYALVWAVFGLANALLLASFPQTLGHQTYLFYGSASVWAWLVGYLSIITPMGLGVREITLVKLLTTPETTAVASVMAITTRVWLIVSELIFLLGVIMFSRKK